MIIGRDRETVVENIRKAAESGAFLDKYIPAVEQMHTTLKKYSAAFTATIAENKKLKKKTE